MDDLDDGTSPLPTNKTSLDGFEEKRHLVKWIIPPIVLVTFAIFLVIFIYNACILKHRPPPNRTRVEQVNEQWQTTFDGSPVPCVKEESPDKSRVVRFEGVHVVKES